VKYQDAPQFSLVSDAGWTVLQLPSAPASATSVPTFPAPAPPPVVDPLMGMLGDLRSRDVGVVTAALERADAFARVHVAQVIDLLAREEVLVAARTALATLAASHLGMLIDAMVHPETDFAIRRRLPRIIGTVPVQRSLDGLLAGLDDQRFEVRYHCSRAMVRILTRHPELSIHPARVIAIVERELSVPPQRWRGYKLLDRSESDTPGEPTDIQTDTSTYLQYVTSLLSTIITPEPLDAAIRGVRSSDPGVRGLAREYLVQVLPTAVLERLTELIGVDSAEGSSLTRDDRGATAQATPRASGVPAQSDGPPQAT